MDRYINESLNIIGSNNKSTFLLGEKLRNGNWQIAFNSVTLKLKDEGTKQIPVSVSCNLCGQVEVDIYGDLTAVDTTLFQFVAEKNTTTQTNTQTFQSSSLVWLDITQAEKDISLYYKDSFERKEFQDNAFEASALVFLRRIK